MVTSRFHVSQVDESLAIELSQEPATAFYAAMNFQLGCAIGELIAMGVEPAVLKQLCNQMIDNTVQEQQRAVPKGQG